MHLTSLPAEIILYILQHLPIPSLHELSLTSKYWNELIKANESFLYHSAAVLHGFIPPTAGFLTDLTNLFSVHSLSGVNSWKSFCRKRIEIAQSWKGKAPSSILANYSTGEAVHRIKVDEERGFLITTSFRGGLIVTDLYTDQVLWSLPPSYVRQAAHCEYGEGYIIFDREGNCKEVWRLASDFSEIDKRQSSLPDQRQQKQSLQSIEDHHSTPRGHFKPWALLQSLIRTRAFRFVYPTLLVSGHPKAFLFDVPSGELIQTISSEELPSIGVVNYVELSQRHVFICGRSLRIFSRADGKCVLDVPSRRALYGNWRYTLLPTQNVELDTPGRVVITQNSEVNYSAGERDYPLIDIFKAVHVSPDGRDFVAMLSASRVLIVQEWERAISHPNEEAVNLRDITLDVQLGSPQGASVYLAFENGRAAVATAHGIFILHLPGPFSPSDSNPSPLTISRIPYFGNSETLSSILCLQMTDTGLFIGWNPTDDADMQKDNVAFNGSLRVSPHYFFLDHSYYVVADPLPEFFPDRSVVCWVDFAPDMELQSDRVLAGSAFVEMEVI